MSYLYKTNAVLRGDKMKNKKDILKEIDELIKEARDGGGAAAEAAWYSQACAVGIKFLVENSK